MQSLCVFCFVFAGSFLWIFTHLSLLVVEHAYEVFKLMQIVQVSVASTFVLPKEQRPAKPTMYRVHNEMHDLRTTLRQVADSKRVRPGTESQRTRKNGAGGNKYNVP